MYAIFPRYWPSHGDWLAIPNLQWHLHRYNFWWLIALSIYLYTHSAIPDSEEHSKECLALSLKWFPKFIMDRTKSDKCIFTYLFMFFTIYVYICEVKNDLWLRGSSWLWMYRSSTIMTLLAIIHCEHYYDNNSPTSLIYVLPCTWLCESCI